MEVEHTYKVSKNLIGVLNKKISAMMKEDFFKEETPAIKSAYEIERNKPSPDRIHGHIQAQIGFQLSLKYEDQFNIESEVTLDTQPISMTPDICIYPKSILRMSDMKEKEPQMPLSTIEIQNPSQSPEDLVQRVWVYYFPAGVKSAWIVIPALKAVRIILPDDRNFLFMTGELHDPTNDIRIPVEKIFEGLIL